MLYEVITPYSWAVFYTIVLVLAVSFVLLDTFVIPHVGTTAVSSENAAIVLSNNNSTIQASDTYASAESETNDIDSTSSESTVVITENSYSDENIRITSYNVCYTKLLRFFSSNAFFVLSASLMQFAQPPPNTFTSI